MEKLTLEEAVIDTLFIPFIRYNSSTTWWAFHRSLEHEWKPIYID